MRRISLLLVSLIVLTIQAALAQSFSVKGRCFRWRQRTADWCDNPSGGYNEWCCY